MAMDSIIDRFLNAPESSEEARGEFNVAARMMATENALGVGINNFSEVLTKEDRYREHIVVMANEESAGVAHHIYLLTAAEIGWGGMGVMVLIFLRYLWSAWALFRTEPDGAAGLVGGAIVIGSLALHATGFLEWALRVTPASYVYVAVSTIPMAMIERNKSSDRLDLLRETEDERDATNSTAKPAV